MIQFSFKINWSQTDDSYGIVRASDPEDAERRVRARFPHARYVTIYGPIALEIE